jgi:hypothetical protein
MEPEPNICGALQRILKVGNFRPLNFAGVSDILPIAENCNVGRFLVANRRRVTTGRSELTGYLSETLNDFDVSKHFAAIRQREFNLRNRVRPCLGQNIVVQQNEGPLSQTQEIGLLSNGSPLEQSESGIDNADQQQALLNVRRGNQRFILGACVYCGGFFLMFYGAKRFNQSKVQGGLIIVGCIFIAFSGGCLMFFGTWW